LDALAQSKLGFHSVLDFVSDVAAGGVVVVVVVGGKLVVVVVVVVLVVLVVVVVVFWAIALLISSAIQSFMISYSNLLMPPIETICLS